MIGANVRDISSHNSMASLCIWIKIFSSAFNWLFWSFDNLRPICWAEALTFNFSCKLLLIVISCCLNISNCAARWKHIPKNIVAIPVAATAVNQLDHAEKKYAISYAGDFWTLNGNLIIKYNFFSKLQKCKIKFLLCFQWQTIKSFWAIYVEIKFKKARHQYKENSSEKNWYWRHNRA